MSPKPCPVCSGTIAGPALVCGRCGIAQHVECGRPKGICGGCGEPLPLSTGEPRNILWPVLAALLAASIAGLGLTAAWQVNRWRTMHDPVILSYRIVGSRPPDAGRVKEEVRLALTDRLQRLGPEPFAVEDGGSDRVVVKVPRGDARLEIFKELVKAREAVQFNEVLQDGNTVGDIDSSAPDTMVGQLVNPVDRKTGRASPEHYYVLKKQPELTGEHLVAADVTLGEFGEPVIQFEFDVQGAAQMKAMSRRLKDKQVAIVLAGRVYMAPVIRSEIAGRVQITGRFALEEAQRLVRVLTARPLPAELVLLSPAGQDARPGPRRQDGLRRNP
ncbi:MAG: hypothetical protein HY815_21155 [Candidatus Riflebacteria bacterium]|nr:hypothetical protein [Candidatus Riflebacteria bacterium]